MQFFKPKKLGQKSKQPPGFISNDYQVGGQNGFNNWKRCPTILFQSVLRKRFYWKAVVSLSSAIGTQCEITYKKKLILNRSNRHFQGLILITLINGLINLINRSTIEPIYFLSIFDTRVKDLNQYFIQDKARSVLASTVENNCHMFIQYVMRMSWWKNSHQLSHISLILHIPLFP